MATGGSQSLPLLKLPEINIWQRLFKAGALSLLVILITIPIGLLQISIESPKLIEQNSPNFDVYDLVFSGGILGSDTRDKNIVVVNIDTSHAAIATQLWRLCQLKPAVIALDVLFAPSSDVEGDKKLAKAIRNTGCITATEITEKENGLLNIETSFLDKDTIDDNAGYLNFYVENPEKWPVIRTIKPFLLQDTNMQYSFAAKILERYDPAKFQQLLNRKNSKERINYAGTFDHYEQFSCVDLFEMDSTQLHNKIEGKIVLLGYFTSRDQIPVLEDLHYTPLNESIVEKGPPDMYGIGIQANVLSMMLKGNYIADIPASYAYIIALVLIFISWFLSFQLRKWAILPNVFKTIITILLLSLLVWLCLLQFKYLQIRIPLFPILLAFFIKETINSILCLFIILTTAIREAGKVILRKYTRSPKPKTE